MHTHATTATEKRLPAPPRRQCALNRTVPHGSMPVPHSTTCSHFHVRVCKSSLSMMGS